MSADAAFAVVRSWMATKLNMPKAVIDALQRFIADKSINFREMADLPAHTVIGRDSASAGTPQAISITGGLEFTGAGGIQRSALTGDASAAAGSGVLTLATVNANVGSFGDATHVATFTVNAKGLTTAAASVAIPNFTATTPGFAPLSGGGTVNFLRADGTWAPAGSGSVTSVGLAAPSIFTVSGSPVTTSGTLTFTLNTQSANLVFAGPGSGSAAGPTFRSLVSADLPVGSASQLGGLKVDGTTITASGGVISVPANTLPASANVFTQESTTSTSFVDLATPGPAVTMTTGTSVVVILSAFCNKPSASGNTAFMSVAVSGASTIAANAANGPRGSSPGPGFNFMLTGSVVLTGLTAGTNTFTAKYEVDGSQFGFGNRNITVIRLN